MNRFFSISILLSFLLIWITSRIPSSIQFILGLFSILTFGVLHGSNDILLIKKIWIYRKNYGFWYIVSIYFFFVVVVYFLFLYIPVIMLLLFILVSAHHFGEQNWVNKIVSTKKKLVHLFYLVNGLIILGILFLVNFESVYAIIDGITGVSINFYVSKHLFFLTLLTYILFALFLLKIKLISVADLSLEVFKTLMYTVIFYMSSLIWGFSIYFIIWHSVPSILDQIKFLFGEYKRVYLFKYIKKALPFWGLSVIAVVIIYFQQKDVEKFYTILFPLIASVTFPHSIIINLLFKRFKT